MRFLAPLFYALFVLLAPIPPQAQSLKQSDALAKVQDLQGTAMVKPVAASRWTPIGQKSLLFVGDLVRTSAWGANAVEMGLGDLGSLVLGPASLIEIKGQGQIRILDGEMALVPAKGQSLTATGPGGFSEKLGSESWLRVIRGKVQKLAKAPRWLTGYRSSTTSEWMGSLLAKIDGREVPLSVGYHKVDVEIRDQIARTTIEESFKNETDSTLEGVFYFPLPAGASISGFGMWIGGELVEADIVEKGRARQIYEDLLRKKKDPGLLEWSGGNLFKARVWPIPAHSEKRVRIRYTQVLPLQGSSFRYEYALRSDMLRSHPLSQLALTVRVSSSLPIKGIASSSHEMRIRKTEHSAKAEFSASEYRPDKDFVLDVELDRSQPLSLISHQRGEDGYFMLLLTPPDQAGSGWTRDLLPEGKPQKLVIIADTSASMGSADRKSQAAFIASLLQMLGDKDRFALMTCDVDARLFRNKGLAPSEASIRQALTWLASQRSLGWTDLDRCWQKLVHSVEPGTTVVYVGDGIGTSGDGDPQALAARLQRMAQGKDGTSPFVCHAVSTGSTYEQSVLEAMASVGGGSVRAIGSDPAAAAYAILSEATRPSLKNMAIEIHGLRTAAVYPRKLPNLPIGRQQAVLGRYLPSGKGEKGQAILTGTLEGKPVRYTTAIDIQGGEEGNSFLPRLWARRHLDMLLQQGRSKAIQEDIVAFSSEYGIMTPYTSFLVLDTDEQRAQYGLERRVKMRDGEKFFAEAKDGVDLEMTQQQMRLARSYRLRLRAQMLREIARMGRDLTHWYGAIGSMTNDDVRTSAATRFQTRLSGAPIGGGRWKQGIESINLGESAEGSDKGPPMLEGITESKSGAPMSPAPAAKPMARRANAPAESAGEALEMEELDEDLPTVSYVAGDGYFGDEKLRKRSAYGRGADRSLAYNSLTRMQQQQRISRIQFGFPGLPAVPVPHDAKTAKDWPAEIRDLIRTLGRREALLSLPEGQGIRIELHAESLHPIRGKVLSARDHDLSLLGQSWYTSASGWMSPRVWSWRSPEQVGVLNDTLGLARTRKSEKADRELLRIPGDLLGLADFEETYRLYEAKVEKRDGAQWTLLFADPTGTASFRLVVDTEKHLVLSRESMSRGKRTGSLRLVEPVQVAGHWWPTKTERMDGDGHVVSRTTLRVRAIDAAAWKAQRDFLTKQLGSALVLKGKMPKLDEARELIFAGKASLEDLYRDFASQVALSLWDKAWTSFERFGKAVVTTKRGTEGLAWIRIQLLARSRRGEDFKSALAGFDIGGKQLQGPGSEEALAWKTQSLLAFANQVLGANERARAWDARKGIYEAEGAGRFNRVLLWMQSRAYIHENLREFEKAYALRKQLYEMDKGHNQVLLAHLTDLRAQGEVKTAMKLCRESIAMDKTWTLAEADQIWNRLCDLLWNERDLKGLELASSDWADTKTRNQWARSRWLAAMVYQSRIDEADLWAVQRTTLEPSDDLHERSATMAALQYLLGRSWQLSSNLVPEKFREPIQAMILRFMRADANSWNQVAWVLSDWRIRRLPLVAKIRKALRSDLEDSAKVTSLPVRHLALYLRLLPWNSNASAEKAYDRILGSLRERWEASDKPAEKHEFGNLVLHMLDQRQRKVQALAFARLRRDKEDAAYRRTLTEQLYTRLQAQEWSGAIEAELFALLTDLDDTGLALAQRRGLMGQKLRALTDRLYAMRYQGLLGKPEVYKRLPRKELREKQKQARLEARKGLAQALIDVNGALPESARLWASIESLTLQALVGEELAKTTQAAMDLYVKIPESEKELDLRTMRERVGLIAAYCSLRRKAPKELADQVLAFYRTRAEKQPKLLDWRYQIARLLIALDRVDELRSTLASWIVPGRIEARWRILAAYLDAELGHLDDAVRQLTETAALGQLGASEWLSLANWQLALGHKDAYASAKVKYYATLSDWQLRSQLNSHMSRMNSRSGGQVPAGFQSESLLVMHALLQKASYPQNEVNRIFNFYRQSKDHRILASLARGLPGLSRDRVYEFLSRTAQQVKQVHEEATCDEVLATIGKMLTGDLKTGARRALLLLEAQFEARAALVQNQPGPHIERAVAAMKKAFDGRFDSGEEQRMAGYLAALGRLPRSELARLQLEELAKLEKRVEQGSLVQLRIAVLVGKTLERYGRLQDGIFHLETAVNAFRQKHDGRLDPNDRSAQGQLVSWYEKLGRFIQAETLLREEMDKASRADTKNWYLDRIHQVWTNALARGGRVSLGSGLELFQQGSQAILDSFWTYGASYLNTRFNRYANFHTAAKKRFYRQALDSYRAFAKGQVPMILAKAPAGSQYLTGTVGRTLKQLNGPEEGLAFLVERIEKEPVWFPRAGIDSWNTHGWEIARWRSEARRLESKLDARLLAIVVDRLERDLTLKGNSSSYIYRRGNYFWSAKRGAFHQVARKVLELHAEQERIVLRTANYLWNDLRERTEAIAALQWIDSKKLLGHQGLNTLASWLQERHQWKESLPLVDRLIVHSPLSPRYRTMKFAALNRIGKNKEALAVLAEAKATFKKEKRWNANVMAQFGDACKKGGLYESAVRLMRDAIAARKKLYKSVVDSTLANWYGILAESYSGMGDTSQAVEAASNAVIACGNNSWLRKQKIAQLRKVMAASKDLIGFAKAWQTRVDNEGVDAPMIRKYLGLVFMDRSQNELALEQFLAARELSPGDTLLHQKVVECYDRLGKPAEATAALLDSIVQQPMKLELYMDLGRRLLRNGDKSEAERAFTSVVERKPAEAGSHKMLAEVYLSEGRAADSVLQWKQVVRIRPEEPEGWFGVAKGQSAAGERDAARATLESMLGKTWAARFGDIKPKIRAALATL